MEADTCGMVERMSDGGKGRLISDNLRTDEVVAHKLGIDG